MNFSIKNYSTLPLCFQTTRGQSDHNISFFTHTSGYNLLLTPSESIMILKCPSDPPIERNIQTKILRSTTKKLAPTAVVRLKLSGTNETPEMFGLEELPGKINYFVGNSATNWRTNLSTYGKVKYQNIYPGIDAIYSGSQQQLKWDFIVHPGANPSLISLDFTENEQLLLDENGNLELSAGGKQIRIARPVVYQETNGKINEILSSYVLHGKQVSFQLDSYDITIPLIIDPIIEYSTYLGGTSDDLGYGITSDVSGNIYITGLTWSSWSNPPGFPIQDPYQPDNAGSYNAFITKIDATGTLVYSTYLGGSDADNGWSIAVDTDDNAYVTGATFSEDFPTTPNAIQSSKSGSWDVFVTKLNTAGNALLYSTYLGGTQDDIGYSIALDPAGNAYVTGYTESSSADLYGFPTMNPMQPDNNSTIGFKDAFVTKINADGSLGYSTYLGGWNADIGYAITADSIGNVYVTGSTESSPILPPPTGFPITLGCFQSSFGGITDAFVTKLNADGSLGYSTYLGGGDYDEGRSITVDASSNIYVTGFTASNNASSPAFPTKNPLQPNNNGNIDAFVTKINATGSSLIYSTYLGGADEDKGYGITVDKNGYTYVTGSSYSSSAFPPSFPLKNPLQSTNNGFNDTFITKIKPDGSGFIYSTYLGGKSYDQGCTIQADADGNTYVSGFTFSTWAVSPSGPPGFPVKNPLQADSNGSYDIFVLKLLSMANLGITKSSSPNPLSVGQELTYQIIVTNNGPDPATNVILTDILPPDVDFISASTGCNQTSGIVACNLGILDPDHFATITILVKPKKAGTITNIATVTSRQSTPASATITTTVTPPSIPIIYTNRIIITDWRKHPPRYLNSKNPYAPF